MSSALEIPLQEVQRRLSVDNPWWKGGAGIDADEAGWPRRDYFPNFAHLVQETGVRRAVVLIGPRRAGKTRKTRLATPSRYLATDIHSLSDEFFKAHDGFRVVRSRATPRGILVVVAPRRPAAVDVYSPVSTRVPGAMVVWIRGCILNVVLVQVQFFADLAVRQVQPLEIQTQDPGAQG
jgi:hypothetical protein